RDQDQSIARHHVRPALSTRRGRLSSGRASEGKWGQLMEFFLKGVVNSSGLEVLSAVMLDPELYGPGRAVLRDPAQTGMLASLTGMQKWLFAEVSVVVLSRFFAILRQSSA
ncbi:unnamed protein product, partial [Phaeothamnion confervicola]